MEKEEREARIKQLTVQLKSMSGQEDGYADLWDERANLMSERPGSTTPTQQFIEDAIAGGFKSDLKPEVLPGALLVGTRDNGYVIHSEAILLDPLAWQAVGKTRWWPVIHMVNMKRGEEQSQHYWLFMQHVFIDYLADGKTIDEALAAISQRV